MDTDSPIFKRFIQYLETERTVVICTADKDGVPHGAALFIIVLNGDTPCFISRRDTQKFRNLIARPNVYLTAFNATETSTLQAEGEAFVVTDKSMLSDFMQRQEELLHPDADLSRLQDQEKFAVVGIRLKRARLTEYTGNNMFDRTITEL